MNKEEMFKNLSDKDKKEVLRLMSFMKKIKEQERKKELYATYEEYLDLIHISEHLSNENELLQSQLDIANKKLEETKECFNEKFKQLKQENKRLKEEKSETLEYLTNEIDKCYPEKIFILENKTKELQQEREDLITRIDNATKYVKSLSSKGRDCQIYWDIKQEILSKLKESDK